MDRAVVPAPDAGGSETILLVEDEDALRALAERLKPLRPEARVLFVSGYTDDAVLRHGAFQDEVHFLQKPFSPQDLESKVRQVLGPGGMGAHHQTRPTEPSKT